MTGPPPPLRVAPARAGAAGLGRFLPVVVVALGVLLRARLFLSDRALWRDESMLALGLRDLSWAELFGPLPYHQKAPILYLLVQKGLLEALGPSERVLRLLPFVLGVAALGLFGRVVRACFGTLGRTVALLGLATSDWAIRYAAEAKPYGVDLAVAVAALGIVHAVRSPAWRTSAWRLAGLALLGAAAASLSFPGAFVFGAAALTLAVAPPWAADPGRRAAGIALGAGAAAAAAAAYLLLYRPMTGDPFLLDYFAPALAPTPWPPERAAWYLRTATDFFHSPVGMRVVYGAGPMIALAGLLHSWRGGNRAFALFVAATLAITTIASRFMHYPMVGRLLLFLLPLAFWALGSACDVRAPDRLARAWAGVAAAFVLGPGLVVAAQHFVRPFVVEDPRPVVARLRAEARPGDAVYLHEFAAPALHWYAPDLAGSGSGLDVVEVPFGDLAYYDRDVLRRRVAPRLAERPRVWLVDAEGRYSHAWFLDELGRARGDAPEAASPGFRLVLYDTRPPVTR